MTQYDAIAGQSIYDVCLQTYGSLDYLYKLMQDNNINGLNEPVVSRQSFVWDDTLVQDQLLNASFALTPIRLSTDVSNYGNVFYVVNQDGFYPSQGEITAPPIPVPPPTSLNKYQMVLATSFTSGADGTTVITPLDINGQNLIGYDMVQIENEIKPLRNDQWVWNKSLGVLTLMGGVVCDKGATLFILYSKIVEV